MTMSASTLGQRVRALRRERGLSQADLAGGTVSASYVSLIESGRRTPEPPVVELLAERLGTTVEYLLTGRDRTELDERLLKLRFAELALANGAATEARDRLLDLTREGDHELIWETLWALTRAHEALGETDRALDGLERLIAAARRGETLPVGLLPLLMMRCRLLSEAGDFGRSIELGEQALTEVRRLGLEGTDDEIRLASTLVAAYWGRGDLATAQRLAARVIERAEHNGSRRARGSAYWNAALVTEARGDFGLALELVDKALALMAEDDSERSLARLRLTYGWLLLRADPPEPGRAAPLLAQAHEVFLRTSDSGDLASCETELARLELLSGRPADAIAMALRAMGRLEGRTAVEAGRARWVLGLAMVADGRNAAGVEECRTAAEELQSLGARLEAAQAWRGLAELYARHGDPAQALESYRRMADCADVRPPTPLPATRPNHPVATTG
ncbi:helix-turn-helix domain-containing protein [Streptomyces sasae]|uniref:helix-turn-helix domain-containing protein n=1 Tax=Streptomyces sasae TaxID=1266772 RepID=UPI00292D71DF|nr:helix-turn-helix domain-containing protein [Streptomyces sasae]